ncbi:MAG: hypothetical protein RLZZ272_750 [Actinomycetota bacterium]|jgi:preprotein translocase subunit Sss1
MERLRQLRLVWRQLRQLDPNLRGWVVLATALGMLFGGAVGYVISGPIWSLPALALLFGPLAGLAVFNLRAQRAQYAALSGQVGAAAAVLERMRGQWVLRPAVAFNQKQDLVHRVVGRCGIVLVGEGAPVRARTLVAQERKRLVKVAGDAPIHTFVVGDGGGEDEVELRRLQFTLTKLPRRLGRREVAALDRRLRPLDRGLPIPKGIDPGTAGRPRPRPR